jgi:hypothetical protein
LNPFGQLLDRAPQAADLPAEGQQLAGQTTADITTTHDQTDRSDIQNSYSKGSGYRVLAISGYTKVKKAITLLLLTRINCNNGGLVVLGLFRGPGELNLFLFIRSGQHDTYSTFRFANHVARLARHCRADVQPGAGPVAMADEPTATAATPAAATAPAAPAAEGQAPVDATAPVDAQAPVEENVQPLVEDTSLGMAHDLSPWGMYKNADVVVKAVMIGLAIASIITWTIWIAKGFELMGAKRRLRGEIAALKRSVSLKEASEVSNKEGTLAHTLVHDALEEMRLSANAREKEGIKERVSFRLERLVAASGAP